MTTSVVSACVAPSISNAAEVLEKLAKGTLTPDASTPEFFVYDTAEGTLPSPVPR